MNPKVEGNLGAKNEPLGQELSDHWAFEEDNNLFLADICCEWMQGDVGQLLELVRSFFGHSWELYEWFCVFLDMALIHTAIIFLKFSKCQNDLH